MSGENVEQRDEQLVQGAKWDILTEEQSVNVEPDPSVQSSEDSAAEPVSQGITRVETSLPPKIEDARRALVRRLAPNTMPRIETIYRDRSRRGISYIDDLCENWPIFIHAPSAEIDGQETYFPQYFPRIGFDPAYGRDYSGFLSTPERLYEQYEAIRSEIGKKNASIYFEACMDNPLVARIRFDAYPGNNNSDHCCAWQGPDGLYHGHIRLIDEALPLSDDLSQLEARMTGTKYPESVKDPRELECIDTVHRADIIYHEIGHDVDFILNHLRLQSAERIDNGDIETAITSLSERRSRDIECSKNIPEMALRRENISPDEFAVILERRGFDLRFAYDAGRYRDYNSRRYHEMPCESIADAYARMAVCVRHRDHYFARNQQERDQDPEKKHLPIYGEIAYMGTGSVQETQDFLDQELINCGIIAGKRLALFEERIDPRIRIDAQTKEATLPDDFDYDGYQERQEAQPCVAEGTVKFNPVCGRFELVDDSGETIIIFGGDFYRQQNQDGEIELINGDFSGERPTYRIRMIETEQDRKNSDNVVQYGSAAFDDYLGLDTSQPHSILFINDNTAKRFYMPEGGFTNGTILIGSDGWAQDMPMELFVYNGIPKVKIGGILYEVVVGSSNDLEDFLESSLLGN